MNEVQLPVVMNEALKNQAMGCKKIKLVIGWNKNVIAAKDPRKLSS